MSSSDNPSSTAWLNTLSLVLGWSYFTAWSISFYPQVWLNYRRKSVVGLSLDFLYLNLLGFALYTTYTGVFLWNAAIRLAYGKRFGNSNNLVQLNDFLFGLHATILTAISLSQTFYYKNEREYQSPKLAILLIPGILLVLLTSAILAGVGIMQWLDVIYVMGNVKVFISICKYLPQAFLNYQRKSTIGWSIHNILLDFSGGIMSIIQELVDAIRMDDFGGITGNIAKFLLGFVSIFFDVIFMLQHYVLYRDRNDEDALEEDTHPLRTTSSP